MAKPTLLRLEVNIISNKHATAYEEPRQAITSIFFFLTEPCAQFVYMHLPRTISAVYVYIDEKNATKYRMQTIFPCSAQCKDGNSTVEVQYNVTQPTTFAAGKECISMCANTMRVHSQYISTVQMGTF